MTSVQDYQFEWLVPEQYPLAVKFYRQHNIRGKVGRADRCAILRNHEQEIVAIAVLKNKQNYHLLTHVGVIEELRRRGLATTLLTAMQSEFDHKTFCFPFTYLRGLYEKQQFQIVEHTEVPDTVHEQFSIYENQGRAILLMQFRALNDSMAT